MNYYSYIILKYIIAGLYIPMMNLLDNGISIHRPDIVQDSVYKPLESYSNSAG